MTGALPDQAAPLEVAASLLALAMHESHAPVDALGAALERMAHALAKSTQTLERERNEAILDCHATFERELATCVQGLQFHDRLMQQLAHVRNCLAVLSHSSRAQSLEGEASWLELRDRLWHRLSSDSQRTLLDLLLPTSPTHLGAEPRRMNASEGSIELF